MLGKLFLLVILALGIGMAVPSTRAQLQDAARPIMNKYKAKLVPSRLESVANQLEARMGRGRDFPADWEVWLTREFSGVPEDPWGHLYYLETNRAGFKVGSSGPDGTMRTPDDIVLERRLGR